jgi:hypothetical protein
MKRGLDLEKVQAALDRAAYKALHGTREERSGRFLLRKKDQPTPGSADVGEIPADEERGLRAGGGGEGEQ